MMNRLYYPLGVLLVSALLGCGPRTGMLPAGGKTDPIPSMPPLKNDDRGPYLASVFGPWQDFTGSPLSEVGHQGLFGTHGPEANRIALLPNGDSSFGARIQALEKAQTSVRIQALIFSGDEAGLYIADILKAKKAAGVDVRVIVDAASNLGLQSQWMYFDLKQHGIEIQGYEALYLQWLNEMPIPLISPSGDPEAPNHRYHEKLWIIDGETDRGVAVVGGLNIANEYFRVDPTHPARFWRDQDIVVRGSIVSDMVAAFDRNFEHFVNLKNSRGALNTDIYWKATRHLLDETGKLSIFYEVRPELAARVKNMAKSDLDLDFVHARSRFFHNRPRLRESYIQQAYQKLIEDARQEILICNAYFIPSKEFIGAVANAVGKGVRVIILTNSPATNDLPELTMVGRQYYTDLLSLNTRTQAKSSGGNVAIWEWQGRRYDQDRQTEGTIHAKYAVFDRRYALVGSYNLDPRSATLNSETAVVFESDRLASDLAELFYTNDLAFSRRISGKDADKFKEPTDALYKLRKEFGGLFESQL